MTFANPLPWWVLLAIVAASATVAWHAYRRLHAPSGRRYALTALRLATLLLLVIFLMRPVARSIDADARDAVVPILIDTSRSMGIEDADPRGGVRRIDRARAIVSGAILPVLSPRFHVDVLAFGDGLAPVSPADVSATARHSDLSGALAAVRERYRGRAVAGLVLLSDGGDTSGGGERAIAGESGPPIFAIGIGSAAEARDREVVSVTAADAVLDESRVDLAVSAVSYGYGSQPFELRLLENGRPLEVRRVTPAANGAPVHETFHVTPGSAPTVYTIETPAAAGELVPENNGRSVLVQPPARARRVLFVEGAPGFEHGFLKRAWSLDRGLEIDSVVRKGKNEQGSDTYYVQAPRGRAELLDAGYPQKEEALFAYDAIVLANVEADQLSRAQIDATRGFVGKRGGGLLVLGAESFARRGLAGTPLEEVLPLQLSEHEGADVPQGSPGLNRIALTDAGAAHPVMQLGAGPEETHKRWEAMPPLASTAPLGGARPGAAVLAITNGPGGAPRALVAVQRYGEGRSMVFTGEAAWRWRMMMPSSDRTYDTFWRQALRWLSIQAQDPISITLPASAAPGDPLAIHVAVRDARFEPVRDAAVDVRVTGPDGRVQSISAALDQTDRSGPDYVGRFRPSEAGVYRIAVSGRATSTPPASAAASLLVGGADFEMADPRLNMHVLQQVAVRSGGRVITEEEVPALVQMLRAAVPSAALAVRRDLWHNGWSFAAIALLLAAEWTLRRRWGLR